MNLDALLDCVAASSCLVTQTTGGLIIGMLLFLVARGLTLIFGVLKSRQFRPRLLLHDGRLYRADRPSRSRAATRWPYWRGALGDGAVRRRLRALVHRLASTARRADAASGLLRLCPDLRRRGARSSGVRNSCRWACRRRSRSCRCSSRGGVVPPFYLFLIGIAVAIASTLGVGHRRRPGSARRSAPPRIIRQMVSALGINTALPLRRWSSRSAAVLAGLAGALAAPVRSLTPGMGFSILIEILHRHGDRRHGLDRRRACRRDLIGLIRSLRQHRLPALHRRPDVRVHGARAADAADRAVRRRPADMMRRSALREVAHRQRPLLAVTGVAASLLAQQGADGFRDPRLGAIGLFATSLNMLVGYTGMVSFGHGMFFGLGAYAFAPADAAHRRARFRWPSRIAVLVTAALAVVRRRASASGSNAIYFAFLTLAFQMLVHSVIILSWVPLTGGDQGLRGGIPRPRLPRRRSRRSARHLYRLQLRRRWCSASLAHAPHSARRRSAIRCA